MRRLAATSCIAFAIAALACSAEPAPSSTRAAIVGGTATSADPGVVALRTRREVCPAGHQVETFCSGVLVAPRVVLTAAHCLEGRNAQEIEVFFGADVSTGGTHERVVSSRVHPAFDPSSRANDVALLLLARAVEVAPLPRGTADETLVGASVRQVGFGVTATVSDTGMKHEGAARVTAVDAATIRVEPSPALICAGDSGGALFATVSGAEKLVGIARSGDATCISYGVFTRVDAIDADFVAPYVESSQTAPTPPIGEPSTDWCASACARDDDCPAGMLCLLERDGSHCGYRGPRVGKFAGACSSSAECNGFGCVAFGAGAEQSCRCFVPCSALAKEEPPAPSSGSCSIGTSTARSHAALAVCVVVLAVSCRRKRSIG